MHASGNSGRRPVSRESATGPARVSAGRADAAPASDYPGSTPFGDQLSLVAGRLRTAQALARRLPSRVAADLPQPRDVAIEDDGAATAPRLAAELARAMEELQSAEVESSKQQEQLVAIAQELEVERRRYRDLFELAPDAYVVTTPQGEIVDANVAANTLFNVGADSLAGKLLGIYLVGRNERPVVLAELAKLATAASARREWTGRLRRRADGCADVAVTAAAVRDPHTGAVLGARWLIRDISAWVRAEAEARQLNTELERRVTERTRELEQRTYQLVERTAEAEAASRAKATFLATMSHEMRTPLNAVAGYAELLEMGIQGPVSDGQRDAIHRIRRANSHLLSLINDILNFAKLESSRVHFASERVPLDEMLATATTMIEPQARKKGVQFTRRTCSLAVTAFGDREKVLQIVINLLNNSVKFTPAGGTITVSCGESDDECWTAVRDTGSGIPADQLDTIFEPFVQVGRADPGLGTGVGLGLAISRDLARGMGGDLTAESTLGVGSEFHLTLPRRPPPAAIGIVEPPR
jgi:PAS domain S-box-containing protein